MQIYINKDGQQYGPYTVEQLQEYLQQGHFTPQDHACYDGQNWVTVGQVPGLAAGGQAAAAQPQPQAQQAAQQPAQAQATAQQQQPAAVAVDAAAKKKKIILWSSIGAAAALIVTGILVMVLSGDDEEEGEKVAETPAEKDAASKGSSPGPDAGKGTPSGAALPSTPLLDRIPADALAVASLDLGKILEKGGPKAASILPSDVPPTVKKILNDPASVGLDVTEPVRAYFLRHPTKPDEDPTIGIAAKLSDSAKFKQSFELLANPRPAEKKDGYDLYEIADDDAYLAVADNFMVFAGNDDFRAKRDVLLQELARFISSDGSNSFVEAHPALASQASKGYDLGIWVDLEQVGALAEGEAPDELLGLVEGGSLSGGLRFGDGEVVLEFDGSSKGLSKALGGGGVSSKLTKYLGADAPLLASVSMSVDGLVSLFEEVAASENAAPDLDEPIKELGIAPREVLDVFEGDFALSLFTIPSFGDKMIEDSVPEGHDHERDIGPGNFGDQGEDGNSFADTPPAGGNPFGGGTAPGKPEIAVDPPAGGNPFGGGPPAGGFGDGPPSGFGGGPPGGPPPGGPPLGGPGGNPFGMDFLLAASIDDAKWGAVMKKSPPLAGMLAMAQLMGVSVKAENGILAVGSAQTQASAIANGGLTKSVGGSAKSMFTSNDFVIKISFDSLAEMVDPLGGASSSFLDQIPKHFDSLTATAKSRADGGSFSLRLGFTDKQTNSLAALIELVVASLISEADVTRALNLEETGPRPKVEDKISTEE